MALLLRTVVWACRNTSCENICSRSAGEGACSVLPLYTMAHGMALGWFKKLVNKAWKACCLAGSRRLWVRNEGKCSTSISEVREEEEEEAEEEEEERVKPRYRWQVKRKSLKSSISLALFVFM